MTILKAIIVRNMSRKAMKFEDFKRKALVSKHKFKSMDNTKQIKPMVGISKGTKQIVVTASKKTFQTHHDERTISTFHMFKLRSDVLDGLENKSIAHPTIIQILGIPQVMDGKNVFCAAQTGSGKTLVYAVPIINELLKQSEDGYIGRLSRPRALIIAPVRELAVQLLNIFKSFSHTSPFRSVGLIGQKQKKWTRDYLKGLVDVVVGTPNTILKYHKRGHLILSDLQYLVLDEADTLIDDNFRETTNTILQMCQVNEMSLGSFVSKKPVQCILTAATLPKKGVLNLYKDYIPNMELCQSNLHKVLPNVKHTFVKTTQQQKSDLAVSQIQSFFSKHGDEKCIVFCNTTKSCNWMSVLLDQQKVNHSKMHGDMNPQVRFADYERFHGNETQLLVCTDIASRGLDLPQVCLVVNIDCPFNTTDYIHRSGRTGRAVSDLHNSREGEVITYITQNKEVVFAEKIQEAAMKNVALENITGKKNPAKLKHKLDVEMALNRSNE